MRRRHGVGPAVGLALASLVVALAAVEGGLALGLRHADRLHGPLRRALLRPLRRIHLAAEWPLLQLDATCARWDPELTYLLRPPGCTIHDREFTVRYDVNRAGLRDDDASLEAPAIIVLGDSFAMGWGVAELDAFPAVLERRTGLRVLDAAVPSYGTARELRLLGRLDRSALRALILQWCWNDVAENRAWVANGGTLPIASEAAWSADVAAQRAHLRYWPGKYLVTLVRSLVATASPGSEAAAAPPRDPAVDGAIDDLLAVVAGHAAAIGDAPLLVLPLCRNAGAMADGLRARAATLPPPLGRGVHVVDVWSSLGRRDFLPLDGHFTPAGHAAVAARIAAALEAVGVAPR